jgi:hypothetical protein
MRLTLTGTATHTKEPPMHYLPRKWPRTILAGLLALESRIAAVGEFAVDGGQLTELGSVPLPAGATPAGVAVS